jgi:hypothetical protein
MCTKIHLKCTRKVRIASGGWRWCDDVKWTGFEIPSSKHIVNIESFFPLYGWVPPSTTTHEPLATTAMIHVEHFLYVPYIQRTVRRTCWTEQCEISPHLWRHKRPKYTIQPTKSTKLSPDARGQIFIGGKRRHIFFLNEEEARSHSDTTVLYHHVPPQAQSMHACGSRDEGRTSRVFVESRFIRVVSHQVTYKERMPKTKQHVVWTGTSGNLTFHLWSSNFCIPFFFSHGHVHVHATYTLPLCEKVCYSITTIVFNY